MGESAGAPPHTVTDSLAEGADPVRHDLVSNLTSRRRDRSTLPNNEDEDELREVDTEDPEPSPAQPLTLRSKNLDAGESVKCAEICLRRRCAPSLLCKPAC